MSNIQAQEIIKSSLYITLSTCVDSTPWTTPVFYIYIDGAYYWYSRRDARHSVNISHNNIVSAVIYDSSDKNQEVAAVYIEGTASELARDKFDLIIKAYYDRAVEMDPQLRWEEFSRVDDFTDAGPLRIYCLKPNRTWLLGKSKKWNDKWLDYRDEVEM